LFELNEIIYLMDHAWMVFFVSRVPDRLLGDWSHEAFIWEWRKGDPNVAKKDEKIFGDYESR